MNRPRLISIGIGLVIVLFLFARCRQSSAPRMPNPKLNLGKISYPYPDVGIKVDNYPRVDGSTSTQPLQMILACKLFGVRPEWIHDESDDTRKLWPGGEYDLPEKSRDEFIQRTLLNEHIRNLVQVHGTTEAYINLINNRADLILVARSPSEDELILAEKLRVQFDVRPVALDAFVFLLNGKNPVTDLTIEQIRDIYSGRIVNWREVGGPDAPIRPYQRPRNSGSQELMQRLVMNGRAMIEAPDLLTGSLMSSTFLALDKDVYGIGYSVYYYQEFMSPYKDVKACAVGGVLPSAKNIRSRHYPFVAEVYVVVRRDLAREHPAFRLRDWMLGQAGQSIVEESGYVAAREPSEAGREKLPPVNHGP